MIPSDFTAGDQMLLFLNYLGALILFPDCTWSQNHVDAGHLGNPQKSPSMQNLYWAYQDDQALCVLQYG